jgi:dephospho-CoA kinase
MPTSASVGSTNERSRVSEASDVRPALVIGVTGGIGSGKTTVADLFASLGVPVIDADELAREVVKPGRAAHEAIVRRFGPEILTPSGELDRRELRERVFADPANRAHIEQIVHPEVYAEISRQLDRITSPYAIVVVPLLLESGGKDIVDRVLVVDAAEESQIERTNRRDGTARGTIEKILAAQLDRQSRLSQADDIIENNASIEALEEAVGRLHRRYLDEAARIASQPPEMKE